MVFITGRAEHPAWKLFKALVFILLVVAVAGGYLYLHPEIWKDWVKGTPLEPPAKQTTIYKWKNAEGQWQITDRPPTGNLDYETQTYRSDENIVPSLQVPEEDSK